MLLIVFKVLRMDGIAVFWPFYLQPLKIACIIGVDPGLLIGWHINVAPLGSATVSPPSPSNFESVVFSVSVDEQTERQRDRKQHSLYIDTVADPGDKGTCPLAL